MDTFMCGRYVFNSSSSDLSALFAVSEKNQYTSPARYNVAPGTHIPVIRNNDSGNREFVELRWGLIPSWSADSRKGIFPINARAETCATKPMFRNALRKRRCLIIANGFYEWGKVDGRKQPFYFQRTDQQTFAFAGIWERWQNESEIIDSCAIIVGEANELLKPIHDRMPIILQAHNYELWLNQSVTDADYLTPLFKPYPAELMQAYPVSTQVNSPRNDYPELIQSLI